MGVKLHDVSTLRIPLGLLELFFILVNPFFYFFKKFFYPPLKKWLSNFKKSHVMIPSPVRSRFEIPS